MMRVRRNLLSRSEKNSLSSKMLRGAAAGWFATVPMTVFMELAWRLLPAREKYPLPPRIITNKLRRQWASKRPFKQTGEMALTLLLHFLFGAVMGGVYGVIEDKISTKIYVKGVAQSTAQSIAKGIVAGLIVWSGSYLGWIPSARIMPPATEQPWRRNLLMILAHVVWGAALGWVTQKLNSDGKLKL